MISPFLIPAIVALLLSFFDQKFDANTKLLFFILLSIIAAFIYCCTTTNGEDWKNYKEAYDVISPNNLPGFEIGFNYLMLLFKQLGFSFLSFFITIKIICFTILSIFFYNFSKRFDGFYSSNLFLLLFIFYTSCPYLFIEIVRFMIALTIVSFSFKYLFERKFIPFLIIISIASSFHLSAAIMVILYFLMRLELNKKMWILLIGLSLFLFNEFVFLNFFIFITSLFNTDSLQRLVLYTQMSIANNSTNILSIGNIYNMYLALLVFVISHDKMYFGKQNILTLVMIYFILYFTTIYLGSISRIRILFLPIIFSFILLFIETIRKKTIRISLLSLHVVYSIVSFYLTLQAPEYSTFSNYFIS